MDRSRAVGSRLALILIIVGIVAGILRFWNVLDAIDPVWTLMVSLVGLGCFVGGVNVFLWIRFRDARFFEVAFFSLALVIVIIVLELLSFVVLRMAFPTRVRHVVRSHVLRTWPSRPRIPRRDLRQNPRMAPYPLYGWRILPRSLKQKTDWSQRGFRINELDRKEAVEPGSDYRIFITGGSSVMGPGLLPKKTISHHLERILERRWETNVNVVNAGLPAWASANEMAFLFQELFPFYDPDLVVVLDGYNDSLHAIKAGQFFSSVPDTRPFEAKRYLYNPRLRRHVRQWPQWMADPFFVANQWLKVSGWRMYFEPERYVTAFLMKETLRGDGERVRRSKTGTGNDAEDWDPDDRNCVPVPLRVEPYLSNVRSMLGGAVNHDIPIVYALQPAFVYKRSKSSHEREMLQAVRRAVYQGRELRLATTRSSLRQFGAPPGTCFERVQKRFFRRARWGIRRLRDRYDPSRAIVEDLSRLFRQRTGKLFVDWVHYSGKGNVLIARKLAELIATMRKARQSDGSHPERST